MIQLLNVSLHLSAGKIQSGVLDNVTVTLPTSKRFVLLGHQGSGKTSVLKMLAGLLLPNSGTIERFANISYPVGSARGFAPELSIRRNLVHAADLYGVAAAETIKFVDTVSGHLVPLDQPWRSVPGPIRSIYAYALSYALPFDTYLIDSFIGVGDLRLRQMFSSLLERRISEGAGMILATKDTRVAKRYGESGATLHQGQIIVSDNIDNLIEAFNETAPSAASQATLPQEH